MSSLLSLHHSPLKLPNELAAPRLHAPGEPTARTRPSQRLKTWEISPSLHCSIVGTCLTARELRQLLTKLGEPDAPTAKDHALHSCGVRLAGHRDAAGKLLNKALDRRHKASIKRAAKAVTPQELLAFWSEAVGNGDISGAYWAVVSHPATNEEVVRHVFGEVHMLSHLVGSSSRLDIARLRKLQGELDGAKDKIASQERRLASSSAQRVELQREIERLQSELTQVRVNRQANEDQRDNIKLAGARPGVEQARAEALARKLSDASDERKVALERATVAEERITELLRENEALEAVLLGARPIASSTANASDGRAILYVGGRRRLYDKLRLLAAERGITLLLHDGGLEDSTTLLPAVVAQADMVLFPVDHISHAAMGLLKRLCRDSGKSYIPMRSAGVSTFLATITREDRGIALGGASTDGF